MKSRFITISVVLISVVALFSNQIGHTQTPRIRGVARPELPKRDSGQTISPVGLTKANHIYFRAMTFYQTPTSDFADHAEALEAATAELIGANLSDLTTGFPSGQSISLFDLDQVHKATLAVERRTPPVQCGFTPLLAKDPPPDTCASSQNPQVEIFADDFESDPTSKAQKRVEEHMRATILRFMGPGVENEDYIKND